ncbi:Abi-alpha family protein [Methylobacterium nonmethylotrophicum]|uniref:DUF4393 domain-containing protein n=1 Tax=Methylobacterium nonmethylotrophicum TaxID=1141884 RepID=A0A4Z0NH71_9HYPH|nr:Abi-alpha family protein [Methylobacterium nonmethylotrophicum]TGD94915.1 DUF4393 domain-containing protein [Methylobacterium nonmethylotrophicum]
MSDESNPINEIIKAGRDVIVEPAKAQQETAKAASKGMDLVRDAGKFFGVAAQEFALMLGDQMRYYRFMNFNRILHKIQQLHDKAGIHPEATKQLPFGIAIQVLEHASFEEEDDVQDLWASLIANAMNPETNVTMKKVYIDILRQLSPAEVAFLSLIYRSESGVSRLRHDTVKNFNAEMNALAETKWRKINKNDQRIALQNLIRHRCIVFRPRPIDISRMIVPIEDRSVRGYSGYGVDPEKFESFVKKTFELIEYAAGIKEFNETRPLALQMRYGPFSSGPNLEIPEMNHMLTSLGKSLMKSCEGGYSKPAPPPPAPSPSP